MKLNLSSQLTTPSGSHAVLVGYIASLIALGVGLHYYLTGAMNLNALASVSSLVIGFTSVVMNYTGWTIFGFVPVCGLIGVRTLQAFKRGHIEEDHLFELDSAMDFALALGMAGTVYATMNVGKNYASTGSGDILSSFMQILMGFGSTLFALGIIMTTILAKFYFKRRRPKAAFAEHSTPHPVYSAPFQGEGI